MRFFNEYLFVLLLFPVGWASAAGVLRAWRGWGGVQSGIVCAGSRGRDGASRAGGLPASGGVQGPSGGPLHQHPAGTHGSCHLHRLQPHRQVSNSKCWINGCLFGMLLGPLVYQCPGDITTIRGDGIINYLLNTPQGIFRHAAHSIVPVCFRYLASGSGDTTVRFWDLTTETPHHTARGIKISPKRQRDLLCF